MAPRYTVSTELRFSASHSLKDYRGDCARVHGHNWIVRVYYEFEKLDGRGLTVDYRELRSELEGVILSRFDHRHLNDVSPFDEMSPTSENVASEIFRLCREHVSPPNGILDMIEVWESPTDMVRYREEQ